ncbi:MAG: TetR/AcrR family transcriptional regulator [Pleurocapsa sp. SU_196_0]|nr:TetR/AcrR family transcriptional regulator [Pleurocapsa sp. SU_196_0]
MVRPSSKRKHQAILAAAEQIFLRDGYVGANMDDLAVLSQVSKQTVYKHFDSKEALFIELVHSMTTVAGNNVHDEVPDPATLEELPDYLATYAERQLSAVLNPRILQLRRLVIGEATRFPELGEALWNSGPRRAMTSMAARFNRLTDAGWLRVDDPDTAASFFNWLVMSEPLNKAMLLGDRAIPAPDTLRRHCVEAARVFLCAYGSNDSTAQFTVRSKTRKGRPKPSPL